MLVQLNILLQRLGQALLEWIMDFLRLLFLYVVKLQFKWQWIG